MNGNTRELSCLLALCCSTVISTAHVCLTSDQLSCDFSRTMDNGCQKVVRITMATVAGEHQTTLVGITCNEFILHGKFRTYQQLLLSCPLWFPSNGSAQFVCHTSNDLLEQTSGKQWCYMHPQVLRQKLAKCNINMYN